MDGSLMEDRRSFTSTRLFSDLVLLFTALVWGGGFVSQRMAAQHLGFFAFNGVRFLLASLVMLPFILRLIGKPDRHLLWILPGGLLLFAGSALQQAGLESTSAANGGFLTSIYVLLVPIFMAIFWKKTTLPSIGSQHLQRLRAVICSAPAAQDCCLQKAISWYSSVQCSGLCM
jgi:EamA-like transporter family.